MPPKNHTYQQGEHIEGIAAHYGFDNHQVLVEAPENAPLLAQRGSFDALHEGDVIVVPAGATGRAAVGTGRTHTRTLATTTKLLQISIYTEFRLAPRDEEGKIIEDARGYKNRTSNRFRGATHPRRNMNVIVRPEVGSEEVARGRTGRLGRVQIPRLENGKWRLTIEPQSAQQRSTDAARPSLDDHHLFFWDSDNYSEYDPAQNRYVRASSTPKWNLDGSAQIEFRTLEVLVEVAEGGVVDAAVSTIRAAGRPDHAIVFWRGLGARPPAGVTQRIEIDLKPDFLRRVVHTAGLKAIEDAAPGKFPAALERARAKAVKHAAAMEHIDDDERKKLKITVTKSVSYFRLGPLQRPRRIATHIQKNAFGIDMVFCHQTSGFEIGSTLNQFLLSRNATVQHVKVGKDAGVHVSGDKSANVVSGAHFVVDIDGHVVRMADDRYHLQHGGGSGSGGRKTVPLWGGVRNVNDRAIGIEIVHGPVSHADASDLSNNPFAPQQYDAVIDIIRGCRDLYGVPAKNVVGHLEAAVKGNCPGRFFDWEKLEAAGVAFAPVEISSDEDDEIFGGFFRGHKHRKLRHGDKVIEEGDTFTLIQGRRRIHGLTASPIEILNDALDSYGYGVYYDRITGHALSDPNRKTHEFTDRTKIYLNRCTKRFMNGSRFPSSDHEDGTLGIDLARIVEGVRRADPTQ